MCLRLHSTCGCVAKTAWSIEDSCKSSNLHTYQMCVPPHTLFTPLSIYPIQFGKEYSMTPKGHKICPPWNPNVWSGENGFGGEGVWSSSSPRHNKKLLTLPSMNMYGCIHWLPAPLPRHQRPRQSTSNTGTNCRGEPYRSPPGPPTVNN